MGGGSHILALNLITIAEGGEVSTIATCDQKGTGRKKREGGNVAKLTRVGDRDIFACALEGHILPLQGRRSLGIGKGGGG